VDQTEMSSDIVTEAMLDRILVPWHWNDVRMPKHNTDYWEWCKAMHLEQDVDFYVHTTRYASIRDPEYRLGAEIGWVQHWLFKDPEYAIMFRLRWQ